MVLGFKRFWFFLAHFAACACSSWTGRGGRAAAGALSNRGDRGAEAKRGTRETGAGTTQESPGTTFIRPLLSISWRLSQISWQRCQRILVKREVESNKRTRNDAAPNYVKKLIP